MTSTGTAESKFNAGWKEAAALIDDTPSHGFAAPYRDNPARLAALLLGVWLGSNEEAEFNRAWRSLVTLENTTSITPSHYRWTLACLALTRPEMLP